VNRSTGSVIGTDKFWTTDYFQQPAGVYDSSIVFSMRRSSRWPIRVDGFAPWNMAGSQTGVNWAAFQSALQTQSAIATYADTLTTPTGTYPGSYAYYGGVLLPDGRVFCVPYNATTARIYDPVTDTLTTPTGTYPGSSAYVGGVLLPDGRVFCVPYNATSSRIYGGICSVAPLDDNFTLSPFFNKF